MNWQRVCAIRSLPSEEPSVIVAESHRGRRLIGRLDRGADLLPALIELCTARNVRCAEVRAFGTLEEVDLREFDQRMKSFHPARRFPTPFTLVQLVGNLAEREGRGYIEAHITVSRERDNGLELIGGHLLRARVHAVDFVIETFDDVMLRRSMDPGTGLWVLSEAVAAPEDTPRPIAAAAVTAPAPGARPAPLPEKRAPHMSFEAPAKGYFSAPAVPNAPSEPTWADVAAVSAARGAAPVTRAPVEAEDEEEDATDDPLRPGDVIEHPRFGRCEVERIEGDSEYAQVRLRNQRLVRLSLDVLQLMADGMEPDGQHRRFRAVVPR
ncbi:MAG: DNA-binding protein [Myxococcales bacterium]|nr:DNA-binding protein [Myxococcales bacterium]